MDVKEGVEGAEKGTAEDDSMTVGGDVGQKDTNFGITSKEEGQTETGDQPKHDDEDDDNDFEDMSDSEEDDEDEEDEDEEMSADDETGESVPPTKTRVYLPGLDKLKPGEVLEHDPSAYVMLHRAEMNAPCLSFDILRDDEGDNRSEFPASCFIVCGTQSGGKKREDKVMVLKMTNLTKTLKEKKKKEKANEDDESESDSSDEESSDEEEEEDPILKPAMINQMGACNRIRATKINSKRFAASWSELGKVFIYDLTKPWNALTGGEASLKDYNSQRLDARIKPCASFKGHLTEGFAMDWSTTVPGRLITGDCKGGIHSWTPRPDAADAWTVDQRPFVGHKESVEDLQWSPTEANVFASGSVDKTLRIWDTRANPASANMLTVDEAHEADINVISWNRTEPFIVSGGDDALLKVWDLRKLQSSKTPSPVATFKHHSSAITSVEWHPTDSSVFASSGADDQIVQWDLAVEKDDLAASKEDETAKASSSTDMEAEDSLEKVPPQLLFIHMGQKEIKEIHWHPQIPGMMISTALDGINVFKTISV